MYIPSRQHGPAMNANPTETPRRASRRILWLAAAIVVAIAAYTAGWFYIGGELEAQTHRAIGRINAQGRRAGCESAQARGFPFRIGLFCDSVRYEDAMGGVAVSAGPLRSAAQVYDPYRVVSELDGPARLELPGLIAIELNWDLLHSSARIATPLPRTASAQGRNVRATALDNPAGEALFAANVVEAHMRTRGDAVDLAASAEALTLSDAVISGNHLPPLNASADLTVDDGVKLALAWDGSLRGRAGTIRSASVDAGEGAGFSVSGPFSVADDGLIDATLTLTIREPARLSKLLADAFPQFRETIESSLGLIAAVSAGGAPASLPLVITRGRPVIGFVALEPIPPLP